MSNNKDKESLEYSPKIIYEEDYYSDKVVNSKDTNTTTTTDSIDDIFSNNDSIKNNIQDNINHLVQLIPLFPSTLQTAINQVFKPIYNVWYSELKDKKYPDKIPTDKAIIKPSTSNDNISENNSTNGEGSNDSKINNDDFSFPEFTDTDYISKDPIQLGAPNYSVNSPMITTPESNIDAPKATDNNTIITLPTDDEIFVSSSPFKIYIPEIDPIENTKLEYNKNFIDLYRNYLTQLRKVLDKFYLNLFNMLYTSNISLGINNSEYFLLEDLDLAYIDSKEEMRHLLDVGLKGEVQGKFKIQFTINMFSLESTLYHLKNFKATQELRLRYCKTEMMKNDSMESSRSNRILTGLRETYDKKYDTSYINLYKYLNSSTIVLEDTLNTLLIGISAKEILLKKGGLNK